MYLLWTDLNLLLPIHNCFNVYLLKAKLVSVCVYDFCVCILYNLNALTSKCSIEMECKKKNVDWILSIKTPLEFRSNPRLEMVEPSVSNLQFDL